MSPQRIQRKRTAGWRMPEGAVYVGRPTKWSNPFAVVRASSRRGGPLDMWAVRNAGVNLGRYDDRSTAGADAVDRFSLLIAEEPWRMKVIRAELAGKDLACWCPEGQPCHADVLLEIANGDPS